jgi:hypothetical protein
MGDQRSRLGAANLTIPLMLLTVVLIVGFLWWLNMNAESASVVLVDEEEDVTPTQGATGGAPVTEEDLRMTPERFEGQVVRITLPVATPVGTQAFFLDVTDSPFLVKLNEDLIQAGQAVPQGTVTVIGPLMAMTDSVRADWIAKELIPPADEVLVEFATHFIEAQTVEPAAAEAPSP